MQFVGIGMSSPYEQNVGILKKYSDTHFRLTVMKTLRVAGYEERKKPIVKRERGEAGHATKLTESLRRSKRMIWELALCNPWKFFVTLTINGEKADRYSLDAIIKKLGKWLNNYNARKGAEIKYLLIPETHKDGAWHLHGLVMGLPCSHLQLFRTQDHIPKHIKRLLASGRLIYNWPAYAKAFGHVTVEPILEPQRCAAYMSKYITKELLESSVALNSHVYYCSQGLQRAEELYRGKVTQMLELPDFANEYVRIKSFPTAEEALPYFCDKEDF